MKLRNRLAKRIWAMTLAIMLVFANDSVLSVALTVAEEEAIVESSEGITVNEANENDNDNGENSTACHLEDTESVMNEDILNDNQSEFSEAEENQALVEESLNSDEETVAESNVEFSEEESEQNMEAENQISEEENSVDDEQLCEEDFQTASAENQVVEEETEPIEDENQTENMEIEENMPKEPEAELAAYKLAWTYDASESESDAYVEHGSVELISGATLQEEDGAYLANEGADITVKLIPDYGYQVVGAAINGSTELTAISNTNEFTFVMPGEDVYFNGIFVETEDIVANASNFVSEAAFEGEKVAEDGGTAMMTITDVTPVDEEVIVNIIDSDKSIDTSKEIQTIDITMDQLFYENSSDDVWTENITELETAATITLVVEQDAADYAVIRTHGDCMEEIPSVYDSETKTITFVSDKFSDYTLVPLTAPNITAAEYGLDPEGVHVYAVTSESTVTDFNTVYIPTDYHFIVDGKSVNVNEITIESGGYLEIVGDGYLTVEAIIATPATETSQGSRMLLESARNRPSCVDALYDITEEEIEISGDTEWTWYDFEYFGGTIGWGVFLGAGPDYNLSVEGYEPDDVDILVSVSTDNGTTYGTPFGVSNEYFDDFGNLGIYNIGDGLEDPVTNVKINVSINSGSNKRIYYAYCGWVDTPLGNSAVRNLYGDLSYEWTFDHTLNEEDENYIPHEVHIVLDVEKRGTENTKRLIESELYAYSDIDSSGTVDITDMKLGLATELCSLFFWDEGGIIDDGVFDIYKPCDLYDPSHPEDSRIEVSAAGTVTAKNASGNDVVINRYSYTINLNDEISATEYVYGLNDYNQVLVFAGNEYFIRSTSDEVEFYTDNEHPENNDVAICVKAAFDPSNVRIGGNGAAQGNETINPEGDEVYCTYLGNKMFDNPEPRGGRFVDYFNRYYTSYTPLTGYEGCNKIRIINPNQTYVVVNQEGETKDVYGINSHQVDRVSQTGSGKQTEVFIGNQYVHIEALNDTIANVVSISSVSIKDDSMSDGIEITKVKENDFKVRFKSNFYDSVPLVITYADGTKRDITINRVGLVVESQYLGDEGEGMATYHFFHGGEEGEASCEYNYFAGQTVIVYATYYHPTNDATGGSEDLSLFVTYDNGTTGIIQKAAYTPATDNCVAMTDFVIAFRQGREILEDGNLGGNIDPSMQGLHAIVLNSGFDDDTTFSGTQAGSGKGVYWNGHIEWNY